MTSALILFLTAAVAWIVSGSLLPACTVAVTAGVFALCKALRIPTNRLIIASTVLLIITVQYYAFESGYAGIVYEELPFIFHLGMGFLLWACLVISHHQASRQRIGGWCFYFELLGAILIFLALARVEIFRFHPWLVRTMGAAPLALALAREYYGKRPLRAAPLIIAVLIFAPLLGLVNTSPKQVSKQLYSWLGKEVVYEYQLPDDGTSAATNRVGLPNDNGIIDLPKRANIVVDDKVRFFLKTESIEDYLSLTRKPLYLRTSSVSTFEGNDRILPIPVGKWILDSDDGVEDSITTLPERTPAQQMAYAIILPSDAIGQIPLIDGTPKIRATGVFHQSESRYQLDEETASSWVRFEAIGPSEERRRATTPMAAQSNPSQIEKYLSLPNTSLIKRITALSRRETQTGAPLDGVLRAIRERCDYSLKYRNPKNLSPIENLLFDEKKGHCELFATATVLMLRSIGIPSRVGYGYTGGTANREQMAIAFRGNDIHAWAEVLDENGIWRIFDTTPSNRGPARTATDNRKGSGIDWQLASLNPDLNMDEFLNNGASGSFLAAFFSSLSGSSALILVAVVSGFLLLLGWIRIVQRKRNSGNLSTSNLSTPTAETITSQRSELVTAIMAFGEKCGIPRGPGFTLREYSRQLMASGIEEAALEEAVDYFYETRYGQGAIDREREQALLGKVKDLQKHT